jgi:adenylate cyclase
MAATRRLVAIMFTDMVGYTASTQTDEAAALRLLHEEEDLVRPLLSAHHGREVKSTGDGFLVTFDNSLAAVECAIAIQQTLSIRNAQKDVLPIRLRIGVHFGDVEERGGDIFGDAVNLAARIQAYATPHGICLSGPVYGEVRDKIPHAIEPLGSRSLKNVRFPVEVYRVVLPWDRPAALEDDEPRTRIAVLPLDNISPDAKDAYIAEGLTEELISRLSKLHELRVIARTSVGQYRSTEKSVAQIGAELSVAWLLEGSVRKAGDRLRITLQLIDVASQEHVWSESYDRQLDDVFALESEIAETMAGVLQVTLLDPERESIRKRPTTNVPAYELYLKGIHAARQTTSEALDEAVRFFTEATRLDPSFSLAYSALANLLILRAGDSLPPREAFSAAKGWVTKALELDPNSADAHAASGNLALQYDHDWSAAEKEFRRAISLNPSNSTAHFWYGILLMVVKKFEAASGELRAAAALDPLWDLPKLWMGEVFELSGDSAAAIALAEERRDQRPEDAAAHIRLGWLLFWAGRTQEARQEARLAAGAVTAFDRAERARLWAMLGKPDEARGLLAEWEATPRTKYINPAWVAAVYVAVGEPERALAWLEHDREQGSMALCIEYQSRAFDPIRHDPRFRSMVAGLRLPSD